MSRKIARALAVVAVAAVPFIAMVPAAHAAGGCAVNNASTDTSLTVVITYPPLSVQVGAPSAQCSYVSEGGQVDWSCQLYTGQCEITDDAGVVKARCRASALTNCAGNFTVAPGTKLILTVVGGSAEMHDAV